MLRALGVAGGAEDLAQQRPGGSGMNRPDGLCCDR
jgi:hypothetical protein